MPDVLQLDALIVGSGVQALVALHTLQRQKPGASVMLLTERLIGGHQTMHSQAVLHRGYLYSLLGGADKTMRSVLERNLFSQAADLWDDILAEFPAVEVESRAVYVLDQRSRRLDGRSVPQTVPAWDDWGRKDYWRPTHVTGDCWSASVPERMVLDNRSLVRALAEEHRELIRSGALAGGHGDGIVNVVLDTFGEIRVAAKRIFLAAGASTLTVAKSVLSADALQELGAFLKVPISRSAVQVLVRGAVAPAWHAGAVVLAEKERPILCAKRMPSSSEVWVCSTPGTRRDLPTLALDVAERMEGVDFVLSGAEFCFGGGPFLSLGAEGHLTWDRDLVTVLVPSRLTLAASAAHAAASKVLASGASVTLPGCHSGAELMEEPWRDGLTWVGRQSLGDPGAMEAATRWLPPFEV